MINPEELETSFKFLDRLRESGSTNMFGAAPILSEYLGIDKPKARNILSIWMKTFSEESVEERVKKSIDFTGTTS